MHDRFLNSSGSSHPAGLRRGGADLTPESRPNAGAGVATELCMLRENARGLAAPATVLDPGPGRPVGAGGPVQADVPAVLARARGIGGSHLRQLPFHTRAGLLRALASRLDEHRQEYLSVGVHPAHTATARELDIDLAIESLREMARAAILTLPNATLLADGEPEQLAGDGTFLGQHVLVSRRGIAVLLAGSGVSRVDLPLHDLAERIGASLLAGLPVLVLPCRSCAALAARFVHGAQATGALPDAALQMFSGARARVFAHLGGQDIVTFRGRPADGRNLRADPALIAAHVRLLVEDRVTRTLVLGPDVAADDPLFEACVDHLRQVQVSADGPGLTCQVVVPAGLASALCEHLVRPLPASASDRPRSRVIFFEATVDCATLAKLETDEPAIALLAYGSLADMAKRLAHLAPAQVAHVYARQDGAAASLCHDLASRHHHVLCYDVTGAGAQVPDDPAPPAAGGALCVSADRPFRRKPAWAFPCRPAPCHEGAMRALLRDYMQRTALQGGPDMLAATLGHWVPGAKRRATVGHGLAGPGFRIHPGDTIVTPVRQITLSDIEDFAVLTGDRFYAHMDEALARRNPFFEGRVAHGFLVFSVSAGVLFATRREARILQIEVQSLRFSCPVYPGDELQTALTARQVSQTPDGLCDQVWWDCAICRAEGDIVARYALRTRLAPAT